MPTEPTIIGFTQAVRDEIRRIRTFSAGLGDPDVTPRMTPYGYDPAAGQSGLILATALEEAAYNMQETFSQQLAATDDLLQALEPTLKPAQNLSRRLVTLLGYDSDLLSLLGLHSSRDEDGESIVSIPTAVDQDGYFTWVQNLYNRAINHPEISAALEGKYPANLITEQAALVASLEDLDITQTQAIARAQWATEQRDEALQEARQWRSDAYDTAEMALADEGQLKQFLGMGDR